MSAYFKVLKLQDKRLHTVFCDIIDNNQENFPHLFIKYAWNTYTLSLGKDNKNNNGQFFELLIQYLLYQNHLLPFYRQAKVTFVPNVNFDILLYTEEIGPICLSIKTSLRERYKQTALEGMALSQVHRRSKTYLLTLDTIEGENLNKKIINGDVAGLKMVIDCRTEALTNLITDLKRFNFIEPKEISIIKGSVIKNLPS